MDGWGGNILMGWATKSFQGRGRLHSLDIPMSEVTSKFNNQQGGFYLQFNNILCSWTNLRSILNLSSFGKIEHILDLDYVPICFFHCWVAVEVVRWKQMAFLFFTIQSFSHHHHLMINANEEKYDAESKAQQHCQ
jgi:hypothetical protein